MISTARVPQSPMSGQIAAAHPPIRSKRPARSLAILAFRLAAATSTCFATPGAAAAAGTSAPPPVCMAADLRVMTLIEAHGEAQDIAADVLAKAFFTVIEARKACNRGQVDAGIKLYESIPLGPVTSPYPTECSPPLCPTD